MLGGNVWKRLSEMMTPWEWGLVIVTVSVAIWLIVWMRSYFREDADDAEGTLEMLTQFRDLHQEGSLSDDEFRLIRSRLTRKAQEVCVTDSNNANTTADTSVPSSTMEFPSGESLPEPNQSASKEDLEKSVGMTDSATE